MASFNKSVRGTARLFYCRVVSDLGYQYTLGTFELQIVFGVDINRKHDRRNQFSPFNAGLYSKRCLPRTSTPDS